MFFLVNLLEEMLIVKVFVLVYKSLWNGNEILGKMFVNDFDGIVLINLLSEIRLFVWWYFGDSWVVMIW